MELGLRMHTARHVEFCGLEPHAERVWSESLLDCWAHCDPFNLFDVSAVSLLLTHMSARLSDSDSCATDAEAAPENDECRGADKEGAGEAWKRARSKTTQRYLVTESGRRFAAWSRAMRFGEAMAFSSVRAFERRLACADIGVTARLSECCSLTCACSRSLSIAACFWRNFMVERAFQCFRRWQKQHTETSGETPPVFVYAGLGPGGYFQDLLAIQACIHRTRKVRLRLVFIEPLAADYIAFAGQESERVTCVRRDEEVTIATESKSADAAGNNDLDAKINRGSNTSENGDGGRSVAMNQLQLRIYTVMDFVRCRGSEVESVHLFDSLAAYFTHLDGNLSASQLNSRSLHANLFVAFDYVDDTSYWHAYGTPEASAATARFERNEMLAQTSSATTLKMWHESEPSHVRVHESSLRNNYRYSSDRWLDYSRALTTVVFSSPTRRRLVLSRCAAFWTVVIAILSLCWAALPWL